MTDDELDEALAALPSPSPAPDFADRVMARVAVRRQRAPKRRPLAVAASLAAVVVGSMAASVIWAVGHQQALVSFAGWLLGQAGTWTLDETRTVAAAAIGQFGHVFPRPSASTAASFVPASAAASLVYFGGLAILRRLMALPERQVAHAQG